MILLVGPFVAVVGLVAVFFVMRRKSVDKRSMYSARRSQIEHKVRAARQRTLAPHGHAEKPAPPPAAAPAPAPTFAPKPSAPTITYQPAAYQPPPPAPARPAEEAGPSMWDVGASAPAASAPAPAPAPDAPVWTPPPEAAPKPAGYDWTPGPSPEERVAPLEPSSRPEPAIPVERPAEPPRPVEPARAASEGPGWAVVGEQNKVAEPEPVKGKSKRKAAVKEESWQLASGEASGSEAAEAEGAKRPPGMIVALAQYAILVVGLVMVLIGVLVMVANSHVT